MSEQGQDGRRTDACARAAHEANRAYCVAIGDTSQLPWEQAPSWQRESACAGVELALKGATPEESHASWSKRKRDEGWVWGIVKDVNLKMHPCLVPYDQLPEAQRRKDTLYLAVVRAMHAALDPSGKTPS